MGVRVEDHRIAWIVSERNPGRRRARLGDLEHRRRCPTRGCVGPGVHVDRIARLDVGVGFLWRQIGCGQCPVTRRVIACRGHVPVPCAGEILAWSGRRKTRDSSGCGADRPVVGVRNADRP